MQKFNQNKKSSLSLAFVSFSGETSEYSQWWHHRWQPQVDPRSDLDHYFAFPGRGCEVWDSCCLIWTWPRKLHCLAQTALSLPSLNMAVNKGGWELERKVKIGLETSCCIVNPELPNYLLNEMEGFFFTHLWFGPVLSSLIIRGLFAQLNQNEALEGLRIWGLRKAVGVDALEGWSEGS